MLLLLASLPNLSLGQGHIFDSIGLITAPKAPITDSSKELGESVDKEDFTKYLPPIIKQDPREFTCTPITAAYYAIAVQRAIANNVMNDPIRIRDRFSLSPIYVYSMIKPKVAQCDRGASFVEVANFMKNTGSLPYASFSAVSCDDANNMRNSNAPLVKIHDWEHVFTNNSTLNQKIMGVKKMLIQKRPVPVGLLLYENFASISANAALYKPDKSRPTYTKNSQDIQAGHAVTVIGFNDDNQTFTLVNSGGKEWGDNGLFYMTFDDFAQCANEGIAFILNPEDNSKRLDGLFEFVSFTPVENKNMATKQQLSHRGSGFYEMPKKDWREGQQYRLFAKNPTNGSHIIVFSISQQDSIYVYWPRDIKGLFNYEKDAGKKTKLPQEYGEIIIENDYVTSNSTIVIPSSKSKLYIRNPGTDHLCILYSLNPIKPQYTEILNRIRATKGTIVERVQAALGSRCIPPSEVKYLDNEMGFNTVIKKGDVVPLFLEIKSIH